MSYKNLISHRVSTTIKKEDESVEKRSSTAEVEDDNVSMETIPQKPKVTDNNTINKIANRHFALKKTNEDKPLIETSFNYNRLEEYIEGSPQVVISAGLKLAQENNFTFEDRKDSIPSPEKRIVIQEERPEQPLISLGDRLQTEDKENQETFAYPGNMFESMHSSEAEEQPNIEMDESLLNLDTQTGKIELYDDQVSEEEAEAPQMVENDNYIVLKPAIEKKRMITLPKNNQYVNISDMLSRSFVMDSSSDFKPNQSMRCDPWNNLSMNFGNQSPVKMSQNSSSNHLFEERRNEVIKRMEMECESLLKSAKKDSRCEL